MIEMTRPALGEATVEVRFFLPARAWFALLERTGTDGGQFERLRQLVEAEIGGGAAP